MPGKLNPFAHYLFALAITVFGYALYAKFAVPVIEGPAVSLRRAVVEPVVGQPRSEADKTYLTSLVPAGSWELDNCKMLLTPQGTIFFQQWERVDDEGTYDLNPFTLVMNDPTMDNGATEKRAPTILRAIDGAVLKLTKPLVFGSDQEKAEMKSARLDGAVTIFRPASDGQDDDLRVLTRNVHIDRNRVYTLDDVEFAYGNHRGSGRNLAIELAHESESYSARTFKSISGVAQMELASVKRLVLQPEGSNDLPVEGLPKQPSLLANETPFSNQNTPLELSCSGPFVFKFEHRTAEFRDNVIIRQLDRFGDNIHCEKLKIEFAKREPELDPANPAMGESANPDSESSQPAMKINSFVAFGTAGKPAVITSNSSQSRIIGQRIAYDTKTATLQATSDDHVSLASPKFSFSARKIDYQLVENGGLGPLNAAGPGRLVSNSDDPNRKFSAAWKDELVVQQQDDSRQLIRLEGDAVVNMGDETSIESDQLHLLVWQLPDAATVGMTDEQKRAQGIKTDWQYLPSNLTTRGSVKIVAPKMVGTARQFIADWPKPVLKTDVGTEIGFIEGQFARPSLINRYAVRKPVAQDDGVQPVVRRAQFNEPVTPMQRFQDTASGPPTANNNSKPAPTMKFDGDVVRANLFGDLEDPQIKDLSVDGHIKLVESAPPSTSNNIKESDLQITGENLRMVPQGNDFFRVRVGGSAEKLATMSAQGLFLSGTNLHLDQQANKLWIEGDGKMSLQPPASQATSTTNQLSSADENSVDVSDIQQVDVAWTGGMIFDGTRLYFEREILLTAQRKPEDNQQMTTQTFSQALTVELSERMDFRELSDSASTGPRKSAQLKRLQLVNNIESDSSAFQQTSFEEGEDQNRMRGKPVIVQNETTDAKGNLIQVQKIIAPMASVNAQSGAMVAKGPGKVINYQYQDPSNNQNRLSGFSSSFQQQGSDGKPKLNCVHINYDGDLLANSNNRELTISGNVRTAYADVNSFNQTIDPDDESKLPKGAVTLRCNKLKSAQWTPRSQVESTTEMIAIGNAHIKSQLFEATANRLSYSDMTDKLTIEGSPRSDANLWFRQNPKAKLSHLAAQKIMYRLSDQWTDVQGVKNLNIKRSGK